MTKRVLKEILVDNKKYKIILSKYNISSYYEIILKNPTGQEKTLTINPQNTKIKPQKNNVLIKNKDNINLLIKNNIIKQDCIHIINNNDTCGEFNIVNLGE